ncbi:MAG: sugar phosphate isomerase/epimerase family protein [Halanaerobiales bacterium]
MTEMRVAAQLYTVRDYTDTPEDIAETMKKVKNMGYNAVQVSGFGPIEPAELKAIAEDLELNICATHVSFERMQNDLEGLIEEHKMWGCKYMGVGSMPGDYRAGAKGFKKFARDASEVARELQKNDLQFIYHNHNFEFVKYDGVTGLEILRRESDPEAFDFEIDTYWVQAGGGDPVQWIKKLDGRIKVIHFKDMVMDEDDGQIMAEIGEGNLNWPKIIKACEDIGVEWCAVEQDVCQRNPFDSLEISLNNLKDMGVST